jgi:hypothetical protein
MPLLNKTPVTVTHNDGTTELVAVRELTIRRLGEFILLAVADRTPELVALCVDRPVDWIDMLTLDSYGELSKLAIELNFPRATKITENDPVAAARLAPLLHRLREALELFPLSAPSMQNTASSSPEPAVSASAAAIGSAVSTSSPVA